MARVGKVALPGDDVIWGATAVMDTEGDDDRYKDDNVLTRDPAQVAKSSTNTANITITLPGSVTPEAVFLFNTNATKASITNSAGLDEAITIPALDLEGQRIHGWKLLSGLPNRAAGAFVVHLSRPSGEVFIGRIALVTALYDVNYSQDAPPRFGRSRPGNTAHRTRLGSVVVHDAKVRIRTAEFSITLEEDRTLWEQLDASAHGSALPFPIVPFDDENDARWVTLPDDFSETLKLPFTEINVRLEELSSGPPNG